MKTWSSRINPRLCHISDLAGFSIYLRTGIHFFRRCTPDVHVMWLIAWVDRTGLVTVCQFLRIAVFRSYITANVDSEISISVIWQFDSICKCLCSPFKAVCLHWLCLFYQLMYCLRFTRCTVKWELWHQQRFTSRSPKVSLLQTQWGKPSCQREVGDMFKFSC